MKKMLLATTGLVAFGFSGAAAQAQNADISISAFSQFYANYVDQDVPIAGADDSDHMFSQNTEFEIRAATTLDNGIEFGLEVEVEADNNDGLGARDNIDENKIWVQGSFGQVVFGHEDGAEDLMNYGATSVKAVYPNSFNNTTGTIVNLNNTAPASPQITDSGDSMKVSYYTPRMAGFQLGITYAPDATQAQPVIPSSGANGSDSQGWGGGINFVNSFNGFDVSASLTGYNQDVPVGSDSERITGGLVLGYAGFSIGGAYGNGEIGGIDRDAASLGVGYSTGPWSLHVTGITSTAEQPGGDHNRDEINAGIDYALGPGISVFSQVAFGELEDESGTIPDNDYTSVLAGLGVSF